MRILFIFTLQCDILPEIVRTVKGKCEIYVDGGVRRGTDIFKALALGANMVCKISATLNFHDLYLLFRNVVLGLCGSTNRVWLSCRWNCGCHKSYAHFEGWARPHDGFVRWELYLVETRRITKSLTKFVLLGVSNVSELTPSYVNRVPGHSHL